MSRNLIFGGAVAAVFGLALLAGMFSESADDRHDIRFERSGFHDDRPVGGELVIVNKGRDMIVRTSDADVNCSKNGGSVTITREGGKEITITCD